MTHKINLTDTYTTRDGRPARVLCVDAENPIHTVVALVDGVPCSFNERGFSAMNGNFDLIPAPKTHKVVLWVNVYEGGHTSLGYRTRQAADGVFNDIHPKRIACIRVEATAQEGQYDE